MIPENNRPPKVAERLARFFSRPGIGRYMAGDLEEEFKLIAGELGRKKALLWYWRQVFLPIPSYVKGSIYWSVTMFRNYVKTALRHIRRHPGYSSINIAGLSIGMACCILIFLWVRDELSYDRFHENADRIYRIMLGDHTGENFGSHGPGPLAAALKEEYPEIVESARIHQYFRIPLQYEDKTLIFSNIFTDPSFFNMFSFPFLKGDPAEALSGPGKVVLTEETARKFFGTGDPIGRSMRFEIWGRWFECTVSGVIGSVPENSHLRFDMALPFEVIAKTGMDIESWGIGSYTTYIMLQKGTHADELDAKISGIIKRHQPESERTVHLEAITKIHLYNFTGGGTIVYVYVFSAVGLLILVIACINFMNLSTAFSMNRAREIGMRKVAGSSRGRIFRQFLGESILIAGISLVIAAILAAALLPPLNSLSGKHISMHLSAGVIAGLVAIAVVTGIAAGSYPALFLSRLQPAAVLKGQVSKGAKKQRFRKILVAAQFAISVFLLVCMIILNDQLDFIRDRGLGFDKEHIVNLKLRGSLRKNFQTVKQELLKNPGILSATMTHSGFANNSSSTSSVEWDGKDENKIVLMWVHSVDYDYFETFGLAMAGGRFFSEDYASDAEHGFVVNEAAVKMMGIESPVGKRFTYHFPGYTREGTIIGVVKDYNFRSLHNTIEPLLLVNTPWWTTDVFIRISPGDVSETVDFIENTINTIVPDYPFEFSFLDEDIDNLYRTEQRAGTLVKYGSLLALFIACLGLFGLASLAAEQRTREIGIRKVLGASVTGIITLVAKDFLILVFVANLISWPAAYFTMNVWLQNFAYRIDTGVAAFILAAALSVVIALVSVSYQAIRAATADPVESLRYE